MSPAHAYPSRCRGTSHGEPGGRKDSDYPAVASVDDRPPVSRLARGFHMTAVGRVSPVSSRGRERCESTCQGQQGRTQQSQGWSPSPEMFLRGTVSSCQTPHRRHTHTVSFFSKDCSSTCVVRSCPSPGNTVKDDAGITHSHSPSSGAPQAMHSAETPTEPQRSAPANDTGVTKTHSNGKQ